MPDWSHAKEWGERRGKQAVEAMPYFNTVLERQAFIAGAQFSMADITLLASLMFAQPIGLPIAENLTALHAWRARVTDLPAVRNRSGQNFRTEDRKPQAS
jgi:glutathione S-transferase